MKGVLLQDGECGSNFYFGWTLLVDVVLFWWCYAVGLQHRKRKKLEMEAMDRGIGVEDEGEIEGKGK